MVVYSVTWKRDEELSKGTFKGRPKNGTSSFSFSVLCRTSKDAVACLEVLFPHHFGFNSGIKIEDGSVTLKRQKLDSRGFEFQWMMMDKMKFPILMSDVYNDRLEVPKFHYPTIPVSSRSLVV